MKDIKDSSCIGKTTMDATDIIEGLYVDVTLVRMSRLKLGLFLVRLAAWVLNCPVVVVGGES